MKTIVFGIIAIILIGANFIMELGSYTQDPPGGMALVSGSFGYALAPAIFATIFMSSKKFRTPAAFFKITSVVSLLLLLTGLYNISRNKAGETASYSSNNSSDIEKRLKYQADTFNKKLPVKLDEDTVWEMCRAGPGKLFTYTYKLHNYASNELDRVMFLENIRHSLLKNYCDGDAMKGYRTNGITVEYEYKGNDDGTIGFVFLSPRECM
jgi:hypothetical protein